MRETVGIPHDEFFERVARVEVRGTEVLKRPHRNGGRAARAVGGFGYRQAQLYRGAEHFAQDADHLRPELASYPVLRELAVDRKMEFVTVKRDEADGFDPHLENGFGEGTLERIERHLPQLVRDLGVRRKRHVCAPFWYERFRNAPPREGGPSWLNEAALLRVLCTILYTYPQLAGNGISGIFRAYEPWINRGSERPGRAGK